MTVRSKSWSGREKTHENGHIGSLVLSTTPQKGTWFRGQSHDTSRVHGKYEHVEVEIFVLFIVVIVLIIVTIIIVIVIVIVIVAEGSSMGHATRGSRRVQVFDKDIICFAEFLELGSGLLVAWILVWMSAEGELSHVSEWSLHRRIKCTTHLLICGLDRFEGRALRPNFDSQNQRCEQQQESHRLVQDQARYTPPIWRCVWGPWRMCVVEGERGVCEKPSRRREARRVQTRRASK